MNNSMWLGGVALIILVGGALWYMNDNAASSSLGTYAYQCENGSEFTMQPSSNMNTITLKAGSQGMFTGTATLTKVAGEEGRYEGTASGNSIVFIGAGEEVQLMVSGERTNLATVCNPKPNAGMAPWNWGDAGEGGGTKPDVALVVTESIQGKWQSTDDAKFVREFRPDDTVKDYYDNEVVSEGLWVAFEKGINAPEVPFPLDDNAVYIQMTMTGTQADTLNFRVAKLTPEELQLVYLDRGGVLTFKAVK